MHLHSAYSIRRQLATPQNAEVPKTAKFGGFCCSSATEYTDQDEIWHTSVDDGSLLAYQI